MKYSKIIISAAIIAATATCQAQETTINVNVDGLEKGSVVLLFKNENKKGTKVQRNTVKGGKVSFIYSCDSLTPNTSYSLIVSKNDNYSLRKDIYVNEHTQSFVTGNGANPKLWSVKSQHPHQDFINTMDNLGREEYIEIARLLNCMDTVKTDEGEDALDDLIDEYSNKISYKQLAALETMPVSDYYIEDLAFHSGFLIDEPDSVKQAMCEKLFNRLSDEQKSSLIGRNIYLSLYGKTPTVGDKIIDYELYDLDGNVHHLSNYKGKWLVIDFCSYNCIGCFMSAPKMNFLYSKNGGTDFEFIIISLDDKKDVEKMISEENIQSPVFYDKNGKNGIFALYRIPGWPTYYFVSPDGIIQEHFSGFDLTRFEKFLSQTENFNKPEIKHENNVVSVRNPISESHNGLLMLESYELHKDSTVLNFVYANVGQFRIGKGSVLKFDDGKKTCKAICSSIGFNKSVKYPIKETARVRVTFEPLPKGVKEFDYIEGDCETCFRIEGIKTIE